jgi:phosphopantothenoylcysteine decarboxylase/phosphopantothenate--cysteine ligase
VIVGFSLETENEMENSKRKLHEKRLDCIIVNNPLESGAGFDSDTNRVTIIAKDGTVTKLEKESKDIVARRIWEYLLDHVKR